MPIQKISPHSILNLGINPLLSDEYMLAFYKKFCEAIKSRIWRLKRGKNSKYDDMDFLRVFFYSEVIGRSIHNTSELLNEHLLSKKKGRRKIFADGRRKRIIPHQTEVNKYLRRIGLEKVREILRECLDFQLKMAVELKIISKRINVLIDFTEHPYYGKRDDNMIKGTKRQKGTKKMRHYLGFSILSNHTHLYAGIEHVAKGQSKIPIILNFLENLLNLGYRLNYVLMDREFYRAELFEEIKKMGGNVMIPAKAYKKVKSFIESYVQGKNGRVRRYTISSAPASKFQFSQIVYLIIKAKRNFTLQGVKRDFQKGRISLEDARKRLFALMTTEKPRRNSNSWASRTSIFYRRRWLIETGFSDLNRINRQWKSNHDNVRFFDILARLLLYNSWKINRKLIEMNGKKEGKRKEWTLVQNQDYLKELLLLSEKKSLGVMG